MLVAALVHALWNTWLKVSGDRLTALGVMVTGWALLAVVALPFVGMPSPQAAGLLAVSALVHTCYALTLITAYRYADLNVIYAISRGMGPLLIATVSVVLLDEHIGVRGWAGVGLIAAGVAGLGFARRGRAVAGVALAVVVGCLIAAYTVLDGLGARAGGSAHAYANGLFLVSAVALLAVALAVQRRQFFVLARPMWFKGLTAGVLAAAGYWIVIWAMSRAPLGLVSATREASVAIAALLAYAILRERVRWLPLLMVFSGLVLIKVAGP